MNRIIPFFVPKCPYTSEPNTSYLHIKLKNTENKRKLHLLSIAIYVLMKNFKTQTVQTVYIIDLKETFYTCSILN